MLKGNGKERGDMAPLNILVFMTDQQRWDSLGCNGNPVCKTPHLDQLAREGFTSSSCFAANPTCTPSRASLMTGRYTTAHGARANGIPLSEDEITIPEVFSQAGYATGSFGKIHLRPTRVLEAVTPKGKRICSYESLAFWENYGPGLSVDQHYDHQSWFPSPYYGFDEVLLTIGHGSFASRYGHYAEWLKEHHPELVGRDKQEFALPGSTGAPHSWKSAMPAEHHVSNWIVDQTMDFVSRQHEAGKPFLAFCSFPDPHHPFAPPAPYCNLYDDADIELPSLREGDLENKPWSYEQCYKNGGEGITGVPNGFRPCDLRDEQWREIIAHTYGMVTLMDEAVGRALRHLDELGLSDDTLVLFTSDHGDMLGDHGLLFKSSLWHLDSLVKVPLIVRLPGAIPTGQTKDGLISQVDLFQTICDFAGIEPPLGRQGVSQKDYLCAKTDVSPRRAAIVEDEDDTTDEKLRTLITDDWKLIFCGGREYGELYDRNNDPGECANLWNRREYQDVKSELLEQLLHELVAITDPLLPRYCTA